MRRLLFALIPVLWCSCNVAGTLTALGGTQTAVSGMHVSRKTLAVYDGAVTQQIPLSVVSSIAMQNDGSMTRESELWYRTEINLRDGSRIGSLENNIPTAKWAWVRVNDEVHGVTAGGAAFTVPLMSLVRLDVLQR